jgi:hypothetical protein
MGWAGGVAQQDVDALPFNEAFDRMAFVPFASTTLARSNQLGGLHRSAELGARSRPSMVTFRLCALIMLVLQ